MDERNRQMISGGIAPRRTVYQTQKDELRVAIDDAIANSRNLEEFQDYLLEKHRLTLRISRGRFSYLHPNRQKAVTGRMLGSCYEKEYLQKRFEENADRRIERKDQSESSALSRSPASTTQQNANAPFTFIKTNLRLVTDLQQCVKAQQSRAYAQRVKLTNLKQMLRQWSGVAVW